MTLCSSFLTFLSIIFLQSWYNFFLILELMKAFDNVPIGYFNDLEFPATFLKSLATSGIETKWVTSLKLTIINFVYLSGILFIDWNILSTSCCSIYFDRLKNCVYHLMRSKCVEKWIQELTTGRLREPLAYVAKVQVKWRH